MQSLRTISMLLVMLAILLVNRRELTIYEEAFALHTIAHHFEEAHVHVVTPHQHEHETSPHQHHCHLVQDWDLAPVARDVLARKAGGRKYRLHHKMKKLREKHKKEAKAAMA